MVFIALLWLSAFFIAAVAGYFSIIGLATTFAGTYWPVVVMGISLEIGKLVSVSYLYRAWKDITGWAKTYIFCAVVILMTITSVGAFGFLTMGFTEATLAYNSNDSTLQIYESQLKEMRDRKKEIDRQIAGAADQKDKERLLWVFRKESAELNKRIFDIEPKITPLKTRVLEAGAHIGPIKYIAETFNWTVNKAVTIVTLMIIGVFDPLAVALTVAANQATLKYRRVREVQITQDADSKIISLPSDAALKKIENIADESLQFIDDPSIIKKVEMTSDALVKEVEVDRIPEQIVGYSVRTSKRPLEEILTSSEQNLLQLIRGATKENRPLPTLSEELKISEDEAVERITVLYTKLRSEGYSNTYIFKG